MDIVRRFRLLFPLIFAIVAISCDDLFHGGGHDGTWYPVPAKTEPFVCEGNAFVRMEGLVTHTAFFTGYEDSSFFALTEDSIYKYDAKTFNIVTGAPFKSGAGTTKFIPIADEMGWLLTGTSDGNFASLLDSHGNVVRSFTIKGFGSAAGTNDNGFILVATINDPTILLTKVYRYAFDGTLLWEKELRDIGKINCIDHLNSGGFLLGGSTYAENSDRYSTPSSLLVKLKDNGNESWIKSTHKGGGGNNFSIAAIAEDVSGDYIFLLKDGIRSLSLIKTDTLVVEKWTTRITANVETVGWDGIAMKMIGDRVIIQFQAGAEPPNLDVNLSCIDLNGELRWKRHYGGTGYESPHSLLFLESGFCVIGSTLNYNGKDYIPQTRGYIIKTDLEGNTCQ